MNADLRQGGVDPELAEVGVLLQAPDRLDGLQRHLPDARRSAVGPVLEALGSLLGPPPQDPVDGGLADPEVTGYGLGAPALRMERDDGQPALPALGDVAIGHKAAHEPQRYGLLLERLIADKGYSYPSCRKLLRGVGSGIPSRCYDLREAQRGREVRKRAQAVARDSYALREAGRELPGGGCDRCADDLVGLMNRQLSPARTPGVNQSREAASG